MDAAQLRVGFLDRGLQSLDVHRLHSLCAGIFTGAEVDPADMSQAIGVTSWVSWVVNLLIVEWWLHRRPLTSV
jgi:hypothetical protein